jgi:DNA-binding NarL/FixJ family response regulator
MAKLRLLLADDHVLMRRGLRKLLEEQPGWSVVAEASDGRSAVQEAVTHRPDVAILDIGMPLLNGIEAARRVVQRVSTTSVLILSMHPDQAYVTQAVQAGARGYLLKDSAPQDLTAAVTAVATGQSFFSPLVARVMMDEYIRRLADHGIVDRYDTLSGREREILQLVAEGYNNKKIAEMLNVSPTTVETHRAHLLQKLDLHSAAEVVLYAVRRGLVS